MYHASNNATSLEKQKKGNLYVYKFATGSQTPEYQPPTTSVTKRIIHSSVWGSLRKSKSKSKSKPNNGISVEKREEEGIKGVSNHGKGNERERKSVSSVEGILMSLANSNGKVMTEGRKSVSNIEVKEMGKGKGFPFPFEEELKRERESARKSVSHVENNVAYVGKFVVEKGRKSTGAKLENDVCSAIALLQVKVLVTDMPGFMQIQAFECARKTYDSLEKFSARHMAFNLKKEFDKVYGPAWHCIVGSSFGSFVTHATGCFLYFSMEKLCILLFRTKVQKTLQQ